jgi:hypothetical protein
VIKYVPDRDQYHVRDEDDHSNVMTVPSSNVIRLTEDNLSDVKKDDTVSIPAHFAAIYSYLSLSSQCVHQGSITRYSRTLGNGARFERYSRLSG